MYFLYILKCSDNSFYTGITNNIKNRIKVHENGKGSKYVRSRLPVELIYSEKYKTKSLALRREIEVKSLSKSEKLKLLNSKNNKVHIAIMKKSWKMIPKILTGEKYIESRWYKNKVIPWGKISKEDTIFFKDSGGMVEASAKVMRVLQFKDLDWEKTQEILKKYNDGIRLINQNDKEFFKNKRYCILIFLKDIKKELKPFLINKKGFGSSCAWITVDNVNQLKK